MRLLIPILFAALPVWVMAQDTNEPAIPPNYAVYLWGANANGYPANYPRRVESIGTNTTVAPPAIFATQEGLDNLIATNYAAYKAAKSNLTWQASQTMNANIAQLVVAYSNLQWCADNWSSVTNLAALKIAVKAEGDVLLKLQPVLRGIYNGQ